MNINNEQMRAISQQLQQSENRIDNKQSSQNSYECCGKLESLNHFLSLCGVANVNIPVYTWASYTDKTKKGYIQKIKEVFQAVVDTLFRNETEVVLQDVYSSVNGCNIQPAETETDCIIVDALTESYSKAESWQLKRQILSVLSTTLSFQGMSQKIPGITEYRYYIAKKHSAVYGCALPPPITEHHRQKMDPHKPDSFLDFITSSHIIKDLPFGERKMRLSSGKIIETPNVIRCMAPAAIIQQFKQYCAENEEIPLGDSTMFKILTECTANVRKAFEGIDYFIAEGGRAFQDICNVVQELCQVGALTDQRATDYADIVQECKRYLKTDFKVHISELATVPDHCRIFALCDKEEAFSCLCGHNHEMVCCNCEQISELLSSLNSLIANSDLNEKEDCRDEYQYKLSQAQTNIFSWKTHIIRTCHQEKAKTEIMNTMGPNDILIVLDWAMKFLPRRYREDQSNWFAKRGLSWHIGVAFRRRNVIESLAFNHIFNGQIPQDSYATSAVILDIVNDLKEQDNSIDKIHLWSDNAGCYKSSETIYALYCSKFVTSYDFCEAQSGKGACDRTAAMLKSSIRRYINQGNDVLTATQMKEAIEKTSKKVRYVVKTS
ncbi:uncharacterized protein [Mytilus edulis]|uniref:uncharacterized protein n=1 Tax=Mytilus edulis TaxID=6550 RepID=UPI0039EE05DA